MIFFPFLLSSFDTKALEDDVKGKNKTNTTPKIKIFFMKYNRNVPPPHRSIHQDPVEKTRLFKAVDTIPCVQKKAQWALKWVRDLVARFVCRLLFANIVHLVRNFFFDL